MIGSANTIADWIRAGDDFIVCVHVRPDGDAFGTALALVDAIRALNKRAFAACDDPVTPKYRFMPGSEEFHTINDMPYQPACALGADVSESKRMGKLESVFMAAPSRAVIDHHDTNMGFAPACYVDETAAAAGELALDVIDALGVKLTRRMALNLFVAISTDCGNFSFQNTNARSYRYAARCVERGVDVEKVTRLLYRTRSIAQTRLIGKALNQIELFMNGRVAGIKLSKSLFEGTGASSADAHSIVNYANEVLGVEIGFTAEEVDDGVKFSFRSASDVNVARLAQQFGGGGHLCAAGANVSGMTLDEAFARAADAAVNMLAARDNS